MGKRKREKNEHDFIRKLRRLEQRYLSRRNYSSEDELHDSENDRGARSQTPSPTPSSYDLATEEAFLDAEQQADPNNPEEDRTEEPEGCKMLLLFLISSAAAEMSPRIVGGVSANIKDWPFIAFIAIFSEETAATCGGSLISSQTVLTAAHCLDDITDTKRNMHKYSYSVLMGHTMFAKATMIRFMLDYETHHNYDTSGTTSDIGVMFLTKPVDFSRTVKKVILMKNIDEKKDRQLVVAGWGAWSETINETHSNSPALKSLKQVLVPFNKCHKLLDEDRLEGVICAGKPGASEYAYSGDSGGPIVTAGKAFQAGLVSFRMEAQGFTVYTSIPFYYKWIEETQLRLYHVHCSKKLSVNGDAVERASLDV